MKAHRLLPLVIAALPLLAALPIACSSKGDAPDCVGVTCTVSSAGAPGSAGSGGAAGQDGGAPTGVAGQGTGTNPDSDNVCNPGEVVPCSCLGCSTVTGTAFCASDGNSLTTCDCPTGC